MKKLLFIILTLFTLQSFAQTNDTVYVKVRNGIPGVYNISKVGDSVIYYVAGIRYAIGVGTVTDLTNYYKKSQTDSISNGKLSISDTLSMLANYAHAIDLNPMFISASFDTSTRALTLLKHDGTSQSVVIPRGSASGTTGIATLSYSRTGDQVTIAGDNGSTTTFSINSSDSLTRASKSYVDSSASLKAYDANTYHTNKVDTLTLPIVTKTQSIFNQTYNGTGATYGLLQNTGGQFYFGQESSIAGNFFTGSSAYASVLYSSRPIQFLVGGKQFEVNSTGVLFPNVSNATGDFLTRNSSGLISIRTASQVLTDIGAPTTFVDYSDIRTLKPNSVAPNKFQFGFGSYNNTGGSPFSDYINFGGYSDGSAGNQNVIMLNRSSIGMRIYQGTFQSSSPYSTYRDVAFQDSVNSGLSGKIAYVPDIPSLLSYSGTSKMVIVQDTLMGGTFNKVSTGLTTDNGIVYDAAGGGFWQRVIKSNEINSEWFGAKGDGVNNDAPPINAVLTKYPGYTLVLRSGKTYKVQSSLFLTNGTKIVGNGATIQRDTVSIDINVLSSISVGVGTLVIKVDSTNTVEFAKLKVGMQFSIVNREGDSRKLELHIMTITSINGATITLNGYPTLLAWAVNTASLVNVYPIISSASPGAENIEITGVTIDGARSHYTHHRIYWEVGESIDLGGTLNALVSNCFIKNSLTDGISAAGGVNTRIMHNRIWWSGGGGVHLSGSEGTVVDGNYIFDCNSNQYSGHNEGAIIFSNWIWHTKIVNNLFDVCLRGIGSIDSPDNGDITIADNTFRRYSMMGIHALLAIGDTLKNVNISGNHFYGAVPITSLETPYLPTATQTIAPPTYGGIVMTAVDSTGMDTTSTFYNINIAANIFENASVQINHVKKLSFSSNSFIERNAVYNATAPWLVNLDGSTGLFTGNTIIEKNTPARKSIFFTTDKDMVISNNNITSDTDIIDKYSLHTNFFNNKVTGGDITVVNGFNIRNNDMTGNIYSAYLTGGVLPRDIVSNKANSIAIAPGDTGTILRNNNVVAILDSGINTKRIANIINGILEVDTVNLKAPLMYDSLTRTQYISQTWIDSVFTVIHKNDTLPDYPNDSIAVVDGGLHRNSHYRTGNIIKIVVNVPAGYTFNIEKQYGDKKQLASK